MSIIKDLIDNPHPIYRKNVGFWNFLLNSYEGGQDYLGIDLVSSRQIFAGSRQLKTNRNQHLFQYKKEREEDYKKRIEQSYYYNFPAPIIDIYTAHLFKKPIISDWKGIEDTIEKREENIDRMGSSINEFRKELVDLSQIYGHMFTVIDAPQTDTEILSQQDKIDTENFPYVALRHPQFVINWALDEFGNPYWVLIKEVRDENTDPFAFNKDNAENVTYKLWTRSEWFIFDVNGERKQSGTHPLGVVPVVPFYNKRSKKVRNFLGVSVIADISFIARDVYNSCSELRQILREQTFATLTMQGNPEDYKEKEVGTNRGLMYPAEMNQPAYISPDSANAEAYFNHIDRQISAMFKLAKLEGASAKFEGNKTVTQSGISKAFDFNETNQALSEKALNMEDGEMRMWTIFGKWEGKEFTGKIDYPDEFNVKSLNEDLDEAEKALKLQIGTEFNKEIKRALIKKKFSRMTDTEVDKIIKDMESSEGQTPGGALANRLPGSLLNTSDTTV